MDKKLILTSLAFAFASTGALAMKTDGDAAEAGDASEPRPRDNLGVETYGDVLKDIYDNDGKNIDTIVERNMPSSPASGDDTAADPDDD